MNTTMSKCLQKTARAATWASREALLEMVWCEEKKTKLGYGNRNPCKGTVYHLVFYPNC